MQDDSDCTDRSDEGTTLTPMRGSHFTCDDKRTRRVSIFGRLIRLL